ncbi:tetratricopeptide repeat-containing glycosyltransferase family protein [Nisaea sp.]|uniref:tetratricopeptide repeat-containing glycosyltransferase family protein n=1 Tax=Nisaea sp. TaxID=2024842 RepID=UPI002B26F16D|nr:tetratricopeptide repeat-containing glycosyltransferase family protein [Nisaea sp.]
MTPAAGTMNQETGNLEQLFAEAIAQHEAGRLDQARPIYEKLRASVGPNPDILHLLGTLYFQQGSPNRGAHLIQQAIVLRPDPASYYDHFGSAVRAEGSPSLAASAYRRSCVLNPVSGTAFLNASIVALEMGHPEIALTNAEQSVHLMPENADAWLRFGCALHTNGKLEDAVRALTQARDLSPSTVEPYFHLHTIYQSLKDTPAADRAAMQGILLNPQRHEIYANFRSGDISNVTGWESIVPKRLATILQPISARTWNQLSAEYYADLNYQACTDASRRSVILAPELGTAYNSLGTVTYQLGAFENSVRISRRGLVVEPGFADMAYNLSLSAFCLQDVEIGWRYWPYRLAMKSSPKRIGLPPHRSNVTTKPDHLLVASEQGIGDDIRFLSCLPDLLKDVDTVTVETDVRLHSFLKRTFPTLNLIDKQLRPGPHGETTYDYTLTTQEHGFTHYLCSGDLPALYRTQRVSQPDRPGYLKMDSSERTKWQTRLNELGNAPYLGVCWRSGTLITSHRSIHYNTLDELIRSIPADAFTLINLQNGDAGEEIESVHAKYGVTIHDFPDLDQTKELDRVAALMSCLDLVITPSTAVLALACSAGAPSIGLGKAYFYFGDEWDPLFPNHYPIMKPSDPTFVPDRPQRVGTAVRYFLKHGKLPIRKS